MRTQAFVIIAHRAAVRRLFPWAIAETHAFALGTRCANQFEDIGPCVEKTAVWRALPNQRETQLFAVVIGITERHVCAIDAEVMQQNCFIFRIWHDGSNADADWHTIDIENEHRTRKLGSLL
jgi:hypothetical protein